MRVKEASLARPCENDIDDIETDDIDAVAIKRPNGRSIP
jgi:hypothetical protein